MAAGCTLHQGHCSNDYAMTWLGQRVELGLLGVPVGCWAYMPSSQ